CQVGLFGKFLICFSPGAHFQFVFLFLFILSPKSVCNHYGQDRGAMLRRFFLASIGATDVQAGSSRVAVSISPLSRAVMIALMLATIVLGIYPQPVLRAIKAQQANVAKIENR